VQNIAESKDAGDYELYLDASSNPDGLLVYIGGQPLTGHIFLRELEYGSFSMTVEVFRGPSKYEYEPIKIIFASICDYDNVHTSITLTPSYIRTCARAEFHKNFRTFAVSSDRYDSLAIFFFNLQPRCCEHLQPSLGLYGLV
jgi:hypothetical protein